MSNFEINEPMIFGHGVPFRYPSDGDIGAGLTEDITDVAGLNTLRPAMRVLDKAWGGN